MSGRASGGSKVATGQPASKTFAEADVRLAEIAAELKSKPGPWLIMSLMTAAAAGPVAIAAMFLSNDIGEVKAIALEAASLAKEAADNSGQAVGQIDALVVAMASEVAKPIRSQQQVFALKRLVPEDVFVGLQREGGKLDHIRYAEFKSLEWLFMNAQDFNALPSETKDRFSDSVAVMNARLEIEVVTEPQE